MAVMRVIEAMSFLPISCREIDYGYEIAGCKQDARTLTFFIIRVRSRICIKMMARRKFSDVILTLNQQGERAPTRLSTIGELVDWELLTYQKIMDDIFETSFRI